MNDFERIKRNSQLTTINTSYTPQNNSNANINLNQSLNLKQMRSLELKKKIIEYDIAKKEDAQNAEVERYTSMINKSKIQMEKGEDSIRAMDKLILYAKIATIRDRQLKEKLELEEAAKKKDAKLELMMELERLKELSQQDKKANELKKQRKEGSRIIIEQIKDNERAKSLKREMTQKEGIEMINYIKTLEKEDRLKAEEAKKRSEELYKEAIFSNRESIEQKKRMVLNEKEYEMRIFQYLKNKEKKEEDEAKEKKRLFEEKEAKMQKLRAAQETTKDKEEALNLIRARREYEANEKKEREKIADGLLIKSRRIKDFLTVNDLQRLDKEMKLVEQSEQERCFFEQLIDKQQKELDEENKIKENYRKMLYEHNYQLRRQMKEKEEKERIATIDKYEEGMRIRKDNNDFMRFLQEKKKDKIKELASLNLKPSYLSDLKRFKINQI